MFKYGYEAVLILRLVGLRPDLHGDLAIVVDQHGNLMLLGVTSTCDGFDLHDHYLLNSICMLFRKAPDGFIVADFKSDQIMYPHHAVTIRKLHTELHDFNRRAGSKSCNTLESCHQFFV